MDGAEKLLSTLKGLPLWILAALSAIAIAALLDAPLRAGLPSNVRAPLPLLTLGLVVLTVFGGLAQISAHLQSRRQAQGVEDRERLQSVYAPLVALFIRRHVTACTGVGAPRFRHRFANARGELFRYRRLRVGMRRAIKALGDRQSSTSAEVEYGGEFPLSEIHSLVAAKPAIAGPELLNLVRRADRSQYEDGPRSGLLTDEEFALFEHVHREHDRLTRHR